GPLDAPRFRAPPVAGEARSSWPGTHETRGRPFPSTSPAAVAVISSGGRLRLPPVPPRAAAGDPRDPTSALPSTSPAAVAPDRLLDLGRMLGQVLLDLFVGQIEVAQDAFVEGLGLRPIVSLAAQEQRLEHGGAEDGVLALFSGPGQRHARRGDTSTVCRLAREEGGS